MINARVETVAERPAFRRAFERYRCLIVADGFYEWRRVPSRPQAGLPHHPRRRPPVRVRRPVVDLARRGRAAKLRTCTILTTAASSAIAPLHDRMPVILAPGDRGGLARARAAAGTRLHELLVGLSPGNRASSRRARGKRRPLRRAGVPGARARRAPDGAVLKWPHTRSARELAFVLGGGGVLGAHEVGMLRALAERGVRPDIVLGTSVGAINGAFFAADPTLAGVERLSELWRESNWSERSRRRQRCAGSRRWRAAALTWSRSRRCGTARGAASGWSASRSSRCPSSAWRRRSSGRPSTGSNADRWPTPCWPRARCRASSRPCRSTASTSSTAGSSTRFRLAGRWRSGARKIYVLQVGRLEQSLKPPRRPWEVGLVAFEVARRHRFAHDLHTPARGRRAARASDRRVGGAGLQRPLRAVAGRADDPHRPAADRLGLRGVAALPGAVTDAARLLSAGR